jgi:hypothetical protein
MNYTELFQPQTADYFNKNVDALYMKVFYFLRTVADDSDVGMGKFVVTLLSLDYSRENGIASSDSQMLDKYVYHAPDSFTKYSVLPVFATQDYELLLPVRK